MAALVIHLLFFVSGAAGLIYEILWVRQFGTVFGSTVYSVALVTALFMCGLGIGGYAAGRFADVRFSQDPRSPLRWYGRAEFAIGALALVLAYLLPRLAPFSALISRYAQDESGFYQLAASGSFARYALAAVLLAPITLLMGATLTLLIRYVVGREVGAAGWRISLLYAANTAGAAFGCVLTDTALVPAFGLLGTQGVAVALNVAAGVGALALARAPRARLDVASEPAPSEPATANSSGAFALTGLALGLTGFASMGMQVVWFRHLVSLHGGFRPVFSLLLFVILTGLWVGSLVGSACDRRLRRPLLLFAVVIALFVVSTFAGLVAFDSLPERAARSAPGSPPMSDLAWVLTEHWMTLRGALLVVGLPIFFLGAAFPLANAHVQRLAASVGRRAGTLYLANTAGAVMGSLGAGFLLLPTLGIQRTALVLLAAALVAVAALQGAQWRELAGPSPARRRGAAVFAACFAVSLVALVAWARLPADFLLVKSLAHLRQYRLLALREGVNETVSVMEYPSLARGLFTDGTAMANNAFDAQRYMRSFAHVPLLIHERPRTAMVMCFGVGNTLHAALLHPLERVDLVDLSQDVLEHAHWFAETNGDAIQDPRVRVFVNDGRQHLRMMPPESYDLITGEPPPIAFAGVVALYTREFFALARSRLRPGGMISYWFPIRQVSADAARSLVRGFVEVFPDSVLLSGNDSDLVLLGRVGATPQLDPERIRERLAEQPRVAKDLQSISLGRPQELFGIFAASANTMRRASASALALTDDRPALEYGSARYARHFSLPRELFDVRDAATWCPECLEPRTALAGDGPESFGVHQQLARQLYAHPQFLRRRASNVKKPVLRMPRGEVAEAEVSRSLFLRSLLGLGPTEYRRARALVGAGKLEEGIRLLEDVVRLLPGNAQASASLGQAYLSMGRAREACREFERALSLAPDFEQARAAAAGCQPDPGAVRPTS